MVTLDDYSLVLPVKGAISMIVSLISGLIFFKEKLTIKEIILIIIATSALILVNL
jgi:multidrug transporter EmrE-like cation transporter